MAKECPLVLKLLVEEHILCNFMLLMVHSALHLIHSKIQMCHAQVMNGYTYHFKQGDTDLYQITQCISHSLHVK